MDLMALDPSEGLAALQSSDGRTGRPEKVAFSGLTGQAAGGRIILPEMTRAARASQDRISVVPPIGAA